MLMYFLDKNVVLGSGSVILPDVTIECGVAVGALSMGAKIFLDKQNPVYSFFKKNGAIIFSLDDCNAENLNKKLTLEEIEINRRILKNHWSRDIIAKKTKEMIATVKGMRNEAKPISQ